jgi:flagellar hook-basal body complex protein FliE
MDSKSLVASNAYSEALKRPAVKGSDPVDASQSGAGVSFSDMLKEVAEDVVETTQKAENVSIQAAAKQAELIDVVTAVTNAELALESVVAVRDRVVQAYQDIIKMPI